ncbi:MAG: hypothetical protein OHK0038_25880 [Flammeovirgaceae bacterium]
MDKEQKLTANIKLPNTDLELLKIHFPHYFDKNGNFNFEKFKDYLSEKEINFYSESYGMEWLGKSYARLLASDAATTLLKADETHNSKPENANSQNLLIKGDNLEVLKHLANAYYEKIKMIYIDPPYNTGSDDFEYNDDRKYTVKELQNLIGIDEEKAKRILDFTQSKSNSHSAWLTFMYPRLYIAKQLLREDGVIFVSIDDNEVAQLRLLMDEIFGEENFVGVFLWKKNKSGNQNSKYISVQHEYILSFAKHNGQGEWKIPYSKDDLKDYREKDDKGLFYWKPIKHSTRGKDIKIELDGKEFLVKKSIYTKETLLEMLNNNEAELRLNSKKEFQLYKKQRLGGGLLPYSFLDPNKFPMTENGVAEVSTLFDNNSLFDNPKPSMIISHFVKMSTNNNDLILDFFAGSGTTGDAVMQLNAEDGGNRKFILVQLPEPIDPKKNKTAYDFVKNELKAKPTIFEITKERLLRAAEKIKAETINKKIAEKEKEIKECERQLSIEGKAKQIEELKQEIVALQNQDLGFKIFETMPIWDDYLFEAEEFDASQTLFDESKLSEEDIQALLTTWKTYDGIPLTQELEKVDLSGYLSYYGNGKLYLMHKGFTTDNLITLLEKIDSDKHFEPKTVIAFGYHFESARLRELAENLKSYNNKKKTDIDFITRY